MLVTVRPDPLASLSVSEVTTDMVTLLWILGFNGNSVITAVVISYQTEENYQTMFSSMMTIQEQGSGSLPNETTITGLEPHTLYSFTALAVNDFGSSESVTINVWTLPIREF